jgi:serine/threonine protein kinase
VHLSSGEFVGGRYRVVDLVPLGGGDQARVYSIRDEGGSGEDLALKIYRQEIQPQAEVMRLLAGVRHTNLLGMLAFGWHDGLFYEVMPLARGGRLTEGELLSAEEIERQVLPAVLSVLEFCHDQGVIHRNVSPESLLYLDAARTQIVLGGFGSAALLSPDKALAWVRQAEASVHCAPEVRQGIVGRESDYYSLGSTLLHLATGTASLPDPETWPARLGTLIAGLLEKEPIKRWGAREVRRWLEGQTMLPAPSAVAEVSVVSAFQFEGERLTDRPSLAVALARRWDEAKKRLYRGQVREWAKQFDLDLANRVQDIEEEEEDQDRGVYTLLRLLHPAGPFVYRGLTATSPTDLGQALGPDPIHGDSVRVLALEALSCGVLGEWLRELGRDDLAVCSEALGRLPAQRATYASWRLHFLLSREAPLVLSGFVLSAPRDLAVFLAGDWAARVGLVREDRVLAWLAERGLESQVETWVEGWNEYDSDMERGLAVFVILICPEVQDDPAILHALRDRVANRLAGLGQRLDAHVFRDHEATEFESRGRVLTRQSRDLGTLSFRDAVELHGQAHLWLQELDRVNETRVPDGVMTRATYEHLTANSQQSVAWAAERAELMFEALFHINGAGIAARLQNSWRAVRSDQDFDSCNASLAQMIAATEAELGRQHEALREAESALRQSEASGRFSSELKARQSRLAGTSGVMALGLTDLRRLVGATRGTGQDGPAPYKDEVHVREVLSTPARVALGFEASLPTYPVVVTCSLKASDGKVTYRPPRSLHGFGPVLWTIGLSPVRPGKAGDLQGEKELRFALTVWGDASFAVCLSRTAWLEVPFPPSHSETGFGQQVKMLQKTWAATRRHLR